MTERVASLFAKYAKLYFQTYFRYSYAGWKVKFIYIGFFFLKVVHTRHDVHEVIGFFS
jgi:hypothetical protein